MKSIISEESCKRLTHKPRLGDYQTKRNPNRLTQTQDRSDVNLDESQYVKSVKVIDTVKASSADLRITP